MALFDKTRPNQEKSSWRQDLKKYEEAEIAQNRLLRFVQGQNKPDTTHFTMRQGYRNEVQRSSLRVVHKKSGIFQKRYRISKRLFDLTLVMLAMPVLLPVFLILAFGIWLQDRHSPLFVQKRIGLGGKPFNIYKFRTMLPNAAEILEQIKHLNEVEWPAFKMKNDPRVTPIGKILRRTSLDELPQIINVIKGNMSLVGPRPNTFDPETQYQLWQHERLEVVPGMTGLWQVSGRSDLDFEEWVLLDITYIEQQSLLFDLNILWRTIESVLRQKGAY